MFEAKLLRKKFFDKKTSAEKKAPSQLGADRLSASKDLLYAAISLSLFMHVLLFKGLLNLPPDMLGSAFKKDLAQDESTKVKVTFTEKEKTKKMIEVKQEETEAPSETTRLGQTNHKTDRETKIAKQKLSHKKGASAGSTTVKSETHRRQNELLNQVEQVKKVLRKTPDMKARNPNGPKLLPVENPILDSARNGYEKLLASNYTALEKQTEIGYQDYIEDDIAEGDQIDLNTTEYRYIGYFSGLRKSIELVWTYPREAARRGMEGVVGLQFSINAAGKAQRVKVTKSSGYQMLDEAIVNAVKLASPFAPLPESFDKDRLVVTGSFSYVLSGWGVAH